MTYSHNNKMTTSASVRIRGSGGGHNHYNHHHYKNFHHSNSIASNGTNLSTSPSGSTSSNCSTSSSSCASSNSSHSSSSRKSPKTSSSSKKNGVTVLISTTPPPTNLTHYAGSKCFDAPAPTALPKPPQHWTISTPPPSATIRAVAPIMATGGCYPSFKRNLLDDFNTHNLKMLLNVQS